MGNENATFEYQLRLTLGRVRDALGCSKDQFRELLQLSSSEFEQIDQGHKSFDVRTLQLFCDQLGISISGLFSGKLDLLALARQNAGNLLFLPERYLPPEHQLGRARSILGILKYVESLHGFPYSRNLLSRLQVSRACLLDHEAFISPLVGVDLLNLLCQEGFDAGHLSEMGKMMYHVSSGTAISKILGRAASPSELYRTLHEEIPGHFDHAFHYRLTKLTLDSCTTTAIPTEETQELFRSNLFGTKSMCRFKQGVLSAFLGYLNSSFAAVTESECMYEGGAKCVYHLIWDENPIVKQPPRREKGARPFLRSVQEFRPLYN
ncbi:hypothetical protein WDW86_22720 [Bdellovibrionota bacterium FG-2]